MTTRPRQPRWVQGPTTPTLRGLHFCVFVHVLF